MENITPEILLQAYGSGVFPMAERADSEEIYWYSPEQRGIIPLEKFHIPNNLKRFMRKNPFEICIDRNFREVIRLCGHKHENRQDTWINQKIIDLYCALHDMGFAHTIECYEDEELVGGLYGVAIGGAFCGESMFSKKTNASKVALVKLVNILKDKGYIILDTQYITKHLQQFGAIEIPREEYLSKLQKALLVAANFN